MIVLTGYIESGLSYKQIVRERIDSIAFERLDINKHIKFITEIDGESMAVCKWVSPKRTRSYPYARVYDILSQDVSKKVSIIPVVKDEGKYGDRDFLQWDTISLLSLLNVFIIPTYYCDADKKGFKLTNQRLEEGYIRSKLIELSAYRYNALHWNIKEFKNLYAIVDKIIECYRNIFLKLNVELHDEKGILRYREEISKNLEDFVLYSRNKALKAQHREVNTIQPKEKLEYRKAKIDIANYLGGLYHFTVDEVIITKEEVILIESKHSKNKIFPSIEDVKDALLKIMLYKSISKLEVNSNQFPFSVALKLTTEKKDAPISLEEAVKKLKGRYKEFYEGLLEEASINDFRIYYHAVG